MIGDTRITDKGIEKCIDVQGSIESWALIMPTEEYINKLKAESEKDTLAEALRNKKAEVSALEIKNLRKLFDGEDMTAVNAERLKLRNEIRTLEGK